MPTVRGVFAESDDYVAWKCRIYEIIFIYLYAAKYNDLLLRFPQIEETNTIKRVTRYENRNFWRDYVAPFARRS